MCNPGELRASEEGKMGHERAVWYVYVRHTFPFDFDKKVKRFMETCQLHHNSQLNLKNFQSK